MSIKAFEVSVVVHNDKSFEIPAVPFTYFSPSKGKYEELLSGPIKFTL